jgi:hypothetical protein
LALVEYRISAVDRMPRRTLCGREKFIRAARENFPIKSGKRFARL